MSLYPHYNTIFKTNRARTSWAKQLCFDQSVLSPELVGSASAAGRCFSYGQRLLCSCCSLGWSHTTGPHAPTHDQGYLHPAPPQEQLLLVYTQRGDTSLVYYQEYRVLVYYQEYRVSIVTQQLSGRSMGSTLLAPPHWTVLFLWLLPWMLFLTS